MVKLTVIVLPEGYWVEGITVETVETAVELNCVAEIVVQEEEVAVEVNWVVETAVELFGRDD